MRYQIGSEVIGETIAQALRRQGVNIPLPCGGRGSCGKCKVRVIGKEIPISKQEEKFLTQEELAQGVRLACQEIVRERCEVECLFQEEEQMQIMGAEAFFSAPSADISTKGECFAAVDLGTTTIAMSLINCESGQEIALWSGVNHQRSYGADVMARLHTAALGKAHELTECMRGDLKDGLDALLKRGGIQKKRLKFVALAGNTVMIHLLMGYPTQRLMSYPFQPHSLEEVSMPLCCLSNEFQEYLESTELFIFPSFSAFVGGDIAAGLTAVLCEKPEWNENDYFFLDLGTNGEMVYKRGSIWYMASAAAGPVFEGGNMSCGVAGILGAISDISECGGELTIQTIGEKPPLGICGSGYISGIASLRKLGVVQEDGTFIGGFQKNGYVVAKEITGRMIVITQEDIREYQLAKAAIQTGIQLLKQEAGEDARSRKPFLLAGGFGAHLDILSGKSTGLLPNIPLKYYEVLGDTALRGCIHFGIQKVRGNEQKIKEYLLKIKKNHRTLLLAEHEKFQERFLSSMKLNFI